MLHTVGPVKGITNLKHKKRDQYGAVVSEQEMWNKGPSGFTAAFGE